MSTFHIITLWCQMNYSDSARIKAVLTNCGFSYSETEENADIIIFDTCSVRQKAEDKITGKLKNISPEKKIWITWCMIQHGMKNNEGRYKRWNFVGLTTTELPPINEAFNPMFCNLKKTYPNLELFFRIDDTGYLPLMLQRLWYPHLTFSPELVNEYEKIIPNENPSMNTHNASAYLPISTGCNQFCAYCIVPFARGLERHFPAEQIIHEANIHLQNGAKELTLLGQIVNKHPDFVSILKELLKLDGLQRLRYTSPYPTYYTPELLALHENEPLLCPHIHIPFQSGSSAILKKMFRGYSAEECYKFIDQIRKLKREISITTDMIIGFPGETEEDFAESLKLVEYGRFDMIYMGIYSPRPGTFADRQYKDTLSSAVKHSRWEQMNAILKQISQANNQKEVWTTRMMMVNEIKEDWTLLGYTDTMKQIACVSGSCVSLGEIIPVHITGAGEFTLKGEVV